MHRLLGAVFLASVGFCAVARAQDRAAIEAGEALYEEHCLGCHGEKLRSPGSALDLRKLTKDDAKDPTRGGNCYCKTYKIEMKPKMTYIIELDSKDFDAYIRLVNDEGKQVAYDDDGAKVGLNAKLIYPCDKAGTYTIFATSFNEAETGEFSLRVSSQETKEKEKKGK